MKRLLALLVIFLPLIAFAQPILRNPATTNAPAQLSVTFPTLSDTLQPIAHKTGVNTVYQGGAFTMTGTNTSFTGWVALSGKTNQVSDSGTQLLYNGNPIGSGSGITNSGVGTNNYLTKWTGTNSLGVSQIKDETNVLIYLPAGNSLLVQPRVGIGDTITPLDNYGGGDTPGLLVASSNQNSAISIWSGNQFGSELNLSTSGGDIENPTNTDVGTEQTISFWHRRAGDWETGGFFKSTLLSTSGDNKLEISGGSQSVMAVVDSDGQFYPSIDNGQNLGLTTNRWLSVYSYGEDVDGDIRVSGNISPRDVPYIWPVAQGATNTTTVLANDGTGVLSWETPASSVPTTVTTLTYTGGTNLIGFNAATNGATFKVTLTNNAFIGGANATNFPNADTYKTYTLHVINNSAGLWTLTFDASKFAWSEGVQPVKSTNGSGYDVYYFHTHGFTNGMLVGSMNALIR